ncbi:ABC transporter permease [Cellulomonas sp. P24]|nr:ABC transporter permease [Cellulomonas sp. P24]
MSAPAPPVAPNPPATPRPSSAARRGGVSGSWGAVIRHELVSSRRERTVHTLLVVFLAMVSVSSLIGWLTNQTVTRVWQQTTDAGLTHAPNPFTGAPPLAYAKNVVIYVILIGALLAIVLGATSLLRSRRSHTVDLLLSRPVDVRVYLAAKVTGLAALLGTILAAAAAVTWVSIAVILHHPLGVGPTLRLAGFYTVAGILLMGFVVMGMISGLYARTQTSAVLSPIVVWSVIVFVVPQLGTAALPVSLLNPVPSIVTTGGGFSVVHTLLGPLSVTEQFKTISGALLGTSPTGGAIPALATVIAFLALGLAVLLRTRRDVLRRDLRD